MGEAPENTLISFNKALQDGAAFIELDVRGSKEGEAVIFHDATLGRTTDGHGRVRRHTLKELKALDAGYWFTRDGGATYPYRGQNVEIPTLEELFAACPQVRAIIEIKQARPPLVKKVIETVLQAGQQDQVLLATEDDRIMREIRTEIRERDLTMVTGFSFGEVAAFMSWAAGGQKERFVPPGQALQIPCQYRGITLVSEQTVTAAHELGAEMFVWTVNETEEMERLLVLGVDGIITDYPARLRQLIAENKKSFLSGGKE
jgi:glycerophosphoryl diester phosphodiesterase